ncbi:MAG TPA: class I SAM-dependent methyltransferase [Thermoleophilaceae bacterium]|nr:class I SAM-dependent methyltransferase [Thermoleophilaceae bacterium]
MAEPDPEELARALSGESIARGDPSGWFERLYSAAEGGEAVVPWDRGAPHPLLVDWVEHHRPDGGGQRALVVGAGLGSDAELVAGLGFHTIAFDVSPTAIQMARRRFPESTVQYEVADLLDPPPEWRDAFDLVVEIITVQALPRSVRAEATARVREFVARGGTLLVISNALGEGDDPDSGPPWPLTRAELEAFAGDELELRQTERFPHPGEPQIQRWRAEFTRPA